jgi:plasmid stability protein
MRTTLDLDDDLVREIQRRAADSGRTMKKELEEILREGLRGGAPKEPFRLQLPTVKGELLPGVDLNDRDSLYDIMEGRRGSPSTPMSLSDGPASNRST